MVTITKEKDVDIVDIGMPMLDTRGRHHGDLMGKIVADVVLQLLSFAAQKRYETSIYAKLRKLQLHVRRERGLADLSKPLLITLKISCGKLIRIFYAILKNGSQYDAEKMINVIKRPMIKAA